MDPRTPYYWSIIKAGDCFFYDSTVDLSVFCGWGLVCLNCGVLSSALSLRSSRDSTHGEAREANKHRVREIGERV